MNNDTQPVILTQHLDLVHLGAADTVALFESPDDPHLFSGASFTNPHRVLMSQDGPLRWRVPQIKADESVNKWFVRLMVLRSTGVVIGSTSFHGPPDQRGMLEIVIGVEKIFQRQGFATQALSGMWTWAGAEPDVKIFRYQVGVNNIGSQQLIRKMGFAYVGQDVDDIDGLEDIFELTVDEFRQRGLMPTMSP
jgi:[ribosomal protein S5]-alanine N-acetyltransferase